MNTSTPVEKPEKGTSPWYFRALWFLHEFNSASLWGFFTIILALAGLSESKIGLYSALCCIPSMFFGLFTGYLCDKLNSIKKVYIPFYIVEAITAAWVVWTKNEYWIIIMLTVTSTMLLATAGMMDSWALQSSEKNEKNYPMIFLANPIGFATGAAAIGFIADRIGYGFIGWSYIGFAVITILIITRVKDASYKREKREIVTPAKLKLMLKDSRFVLLTIGMTLLITSHYIVCIYAPLKIMAVGGTASQVGIYHALPLYLEIAMYLVIQRITNMIKTSNIKRNLIFLMFACVAIVVRAVVIGFVNLPVLLIVVAMLQVFVNPFCQLTPKLILKNIAPEGMVSSYNISSTNFYLNAGTIIASLAGGYWLEKYGYQMTFYYSAGFAVVGLVLIMILRRISKKCGDYDQVDTPPAKEPVIEQ